MIDNNYYHDFIVKNTTLHGTYSVSSDGLLNIEGSIIISARNLKELPVKFGTVTGLFFLSGNMINSLNGIPDSVDNFSLGNLPSLKEIDYLPKEIKQTIIVDISKNITGDLDLSNYTTLKKIFINNKSNLGFYLKNIPDSIQSINLNFLYQLSPLVLEKVINNKIDVLSNKDDSELYVSLHNYIKNDDLIPLIMELKEHKQYHFIYQKLLSKTINITDNNISLEI